MRLTYLVITTLALATACIPGSQPATSDIQPAGVFVGLHPDTTTSDLRMTITVSPANSISDTVYHVVIDGVERFKDFRKGQPDRITQKKGIGYFSPATGLMQVPAREWTLVYHPGAEYVEKGGVKYFRRKK